MAARKPDPRDSDSPYGVLGFFAWDHKWNDFHFGGDKLDRGAALAAEAGIGWVRMDFLWEDIEPQPGQYTFDKYDRIVDTLARNHLHVLGLLEYNPLWRKVRFNTPPDPVAYGKYVQATVHHFKDRVKYWEVWNEPDSPTYWSPQDDMTAYSALLKTIYPVIKKEDRTAQVLVGGLADGWPFKLRSIYKKAGAKYFDIVNIHPFLSPLHENALTSLHGAYTSVKKVMDEFDDSKKPIWFTEIGCPGVPADVKSKGWWEGQSPMEQQQADWLRTVYTNALKWDGVEKIFWAFLRDTGGHFKNDVDYFGLLRDDFSKKPAYTAYQALTGTAPPTRAPAPSGSPAAEQTLD